MDKGSLDSKRLNGGRGLPKILSIVFPAKPRLQLRANPVDDLQHMNLQNK